MRRSVVASLKKWISRSGGKKPSLSAYVRKPVRIHAGPESDGRSKVRRHRLLARWKRRLVPGGGAPQPAPYTRPTERKPSPLRLVARVLLPVAAAGTLFAFLHGTGLLYDRLQSLNFFKVSTIEVVGNRMVSRDRLAEAAGIRYHQTSLIGLDTSRIAGQLAGVSWVKHAEVKRVWPSTVEIAIEENVPVAILSSMDDSGSALQYLDATGTPILPVAAGSDVDFPVITGLAGVADPEVRKKALAEILTFLRKVGSNDPHLPAQSVSEIHVNHEGEMIVYMVEYPFPIFFGNGNTSRNYSRLVQVLRALYKKPNAKELLSQIEYIQMDYMNDKVLVAGSGTEQ